MKRPERALDLPCPISGCNAMEGKACIEVAKKMGAPASVRQQPHRERIQRFQRAQRDYNLLQQWNDGEPIRV